MAEAIEAKGRKPLVTGYPESGHGFREASNQSDMLNQIAVFYRQFV